jgi:hypothetical protein
VKLRRQPPARPSTAGAELHSLIAGQIRKTRLRDYGEGVVDGMIEVLKRLTGEIPDGPDISTDVRLWAEDALRRAREQREALQ